MVIVVDPAAEGAVGRALSVLDFLATSGEPLRLSAIAAGLGLQKGTVHRILGSLASSGYVEQDQETACYAATLKLWELGLNRLEKHPIKRAAAGFLQALHHSTGETVSLVVLSGDDVLYLDKLLSPRAAAFTTRVGSRVPAPLTAPGKSMLAFLPDALARLKRSASPSKGPRLFDVAELMRELEEVRARGYAISNYSRGVISIAAPLIARNGLPVAALAVSAPVDRISASKRKAIIESLLRTCTNMSEQVRL